MTLLHELPTHPVAKIVFFDFFIFEMRIYFLMRFYSIWEGAYRTVDIIKIGAILQQPCCGEVAINAPFYEAKCV